MVVLGFSLALLAMSFLSRKGLLFSQLGAANPSLGEAVPDGLVFSLLAQLGHKFAFSGKF
jgi:hypothetical protein